ncbi:MAG: hypothetical protein M1831_004314 [Alyxoria varia]|nr:MAG: hypothetical protein M1831_004314 [Alyxoria varia]
MQCAISGQAPIEPVASTKSGHVFEKRLIEAYIADHGKDPTNGEDISTSDLVELKNPRQVHPRPPSITSIPALLSVFQNEWDAISLENFQYKQNIEKLRQELSTALYRFEGSVRTVAKLKKERDDLQNTLSKLSVGEHKQVAGDGVSSQLKASPLPPNLVSKVSEVHKKLSSTRRKRPTPEGWATVNDIRNFVGLDPAKASSNDDCALAVDKQGNWAILGAVDGSGVIYDFAHHQMVRSFSAGEGAIKDIVTLESKGDMKFAVAVATGFVKIFNGDTELDSYFAHAGSANSISLHASEEMLATVGADKSFAIYSIPEQVVASRVYTDAELLCCEFHPDGHLLATGDVNGKITVFDVASGELAATFANEAPVKQICFSENGIWMASITRGSKVVTIWDLRKTESVHQLDFGIKLESIQWDYTGSYLAGVGVQGLAVKHWDKSSKQWSEILRKKPQGRVIRWGKDARGLVILLKDGYLAVAKLPK